MIKNTLLMNFLKEEVRLHCNLYKKENFYTYPLTLFLFFSIITATGIYLYNSFNEEKISIALISLFFIGGVMSGAFGLYARDFLERKFGDYGRLFSNTLILPINLKKTFVTLAISDAIFYLIWFIIPTIAGFGMGSFVMGESINKIFILLLSVFLIFMTGLFLMFVISVIYERSKILFYTVLTIIFITSTYYFTNFPLESIFIYDFYLTNNPTSLLLSIITIIFLALLSYISVGDTYNTKIKKSSQKKSMNFPKSLNHFIFKDYIDLKRTGGLIGKPLFTVFIPSILILLLFSSMDFLSGFNIDMLFFSIILGTLGTQLMNSLISSDDFRYYRYMPITLKEYVVSKIKLSFIICFTLGTIILTVYGFLNSDINLIIRSIIVLTALLIYNYTLNFYLTGLNPNENIMQSKIFITYFFLFIPVLATSIMINIVLYYIVYYILYLLIILIISYILLIIGIKYWDKKLYE